MSDEIEARFELYLDALDVDSVKYHRVSRGVLERGEKKVEREGRYDTENDWLEFRGRYYYEGELVSEGDWVQMGTVTQDGKVADDAKVIEGSDLSEAMAQYLKWEFFSDPEAELGEIFFDVTGYK